jgi:hypothetical protein
MFAKPLESRSDERLRVLVLSQVRSAEMEPVAESLERHFAEADIRYTCDLNSPQRLVNRDHWFPDLMIVCQHWPHEYTDAHVRRLFSLLPLARWICVYGAWCEADGRNGSPWPLAVRVPVCSAELRIRHERSVLDGSKTVLPFTASRDEIFAFDHTSSLPAACGHTRAVRVVTTDGELGRVVCDVLMAGGFTVQRPRSTDAEVAAVVWDADPWTSICAEELRTFHVAHPESAVITLLPLASPEHVESLKAAGADAVLAKSMIASDLLNTLENALSLRQLASGE